MMKALRWLLESVSKVKILTIAEMEFRRIISSRKFKLMLAIMLLPDIIYLLSLGNINPAFGGTKVCLEEFWRQAGEFILDFWTGIPAQLLAILIASELIAGEFDEGTFKLLLTKPIRKSSIVLGKWIAFSLCMIIISLPSLLVLAIIVSIAYRGGWSALSTIASHDMLIGEVAILLGLITYGTFTMLLSSAFSKPLYVALTAFSFLTLYQLIIPNISWLENPAKYTLSYHLGLFLEECGFVLSPGGKLYKGDLWISLLSIYSLNCILLVLSIIIVCRREVK